MNAFCSGLNKYPLCDHQRRLSINAMLLGLVVCWWFSGCPDQSGWCPIPFDQSRYERDCEASEKAALFGVLSRDRSPMWISGWSVGSTLIWWITSWAHRPSGQTVLLSPLEGFGRGCGGIKKSPWDITPRDTTTPRHMLTTRSTQCCTCDVLLLCIHCYVICLAFRLRSLLCQRPLCDSNTRPTA